MKLPLLTDMNTLWVNYPLSSQFKIFLDSKCSEYKVAKEMPTNCKRNYSCYISFYVFFTTSPKMTELETCCSIEDVTCTGCGDGIFFYYIYSFYLIFFPSVCVIEALSSK